MKKKYKKFGLSASSPSRVMQWFFLVLIALWVFVAMAFPLVAFWLTKNALCLTGFSIIAPSVYVMRRITDYLFPKSEKDYQIEALKIQHAADSYQQKGGIPRNTLPRLPGRSRQK